MRNVLDNTGEVHSRSSPDEPGHPKYRFHRLELAFREDIRLRAYHRRRLPRRAASGRASAGGGADAARAGRGSRRLRCDAGDRPWPSPRRGEHASRQLDCGARPFALEHAGVDELIRLSDATSADAPETGGILEDISRSACCTPGGCCSATAPKPFTSRQPVDTAQSLQRAGVPVVPTFRPDDRPGPAGHAWIVKPDDGCGCEDVRLFTELRAALLWIDSREDASATCSSPIRRVSR